jgi:hypothetical protein
LFKKKKKGRIRPCVTQALLFYSLVWHQRVKSVPMVGQLMNMILPLFGHQEG